MQVKIGIRFHCVATTYFEMNRLYAFTSSRLYVKEFSFDKSLSMKQIIYQKLHSMNGNTFSFIPCICYFPYHPCIPASEGWSLTTQEINIPVPFYESSITPPLPSVKTIKKLRSIEIFMHARHLHRQRALYFLHIDAQNSQCLVY